MTCPRRYIGGALLAAAVLLAAVVSPREARSAVAPPAVPVLSEIHAWTNEIYTRVAIYTGEEVSWQADTVKADPARGLPPRIFIDIRGARIKTEMLHNPVGVNNGLLRQVRAGRYSRDVVRVVIDLERANTFRVFALPDPYRIVIDIDGEGEIPAPREPAAPEQTAAAVPSGGPFLSAAPPPLPPPAAAAPPQEASPPVASLRRSRVRVMLD
ncbi:MAG: AMIN domain-containing protein, partial [Thermodesulfobacteriota bacterium]